MVRDWLEGGGDGCLGGNSWVAGLTHIRADAKAVELGLPTEDEDGEKTFKSVSKEELFKNADVVSIHVVLSERSKGIVGKEDLKLMKGSGLLVNTSRGPLVDEEALVEVLEKGSSCFFTAPLFPPPTPFLGGWGAGLGWQVCLVLLGIGWMGRGRRGRGLKMISDGSLTRNRRHKRCGSGCV